MGDGESRDTIRSKLPSAASHGFDGEEADGYWLDWLLVEGTVASCAGDGAWAVVAEATAGVEVCATHWGYAVEPISWEKAAWGAATAGDTGLGVEAGIAWLIAARVS